jgi:hypothetical protein
LEDHAQTDYDGKDGCEGHGRSLSTVSSAVKQFCWICFFQ